MKYLVVLMLCLAGCARHSGNTALHSSGGKQKPIVSILPVLDHTQSFEQVSLSEEFTTKIADRIALSKLYLLKNSFSKKTTDAFCVPLVENISQKVLSTLGSTEFVVVAELLEERTEKGPTPQADLLFLTMRLRVLDVRDGKPKLVLQELLQHENMVPPSFVAKESKVHWSAPDYIRTPIGMAHQRMVREAVNHIEKYVLEARS